MNKSFIICGLCENLCDPNNTRKAPILATIFKQTILLVCYNCYELEIKLRNNKSAKIAYQQWAKLQTQELQSFCHKKYQKNIYQYQNIKLESNK